MPFGVCLAARARDSMAGFDAIVGPTIAITPPTIEDVADPKDYHRANMATTRNTSTVNMLDLCAVTLPVALDAAGMPVGAALVFLLAGPATNVATVGAVYRSFGGRALAVYLVNIIVGSMLGAWVFFCGRFPTPCRAVVTFLPFTIFLAVVLFLRYGM